LASGTPLLAERRQQAARRAQELELPTFKSRPGWEFTDISGLDLAAFEPGAPGEADGAAPLFDLPSAAPLPDGVIVSTIEQAAQERPELIERHLGSLVEAQDLFVARNEAGFENRARPPHPGGARRGRAG